MIKRAIDQKQKRNIEQAAKSGLDIISGMMAHDYNGVRKGISEIQTSEVQE